MPGLAASSVRRLLINRSACVHQGYRGSVADTQTAGKNLGKKTEKEVTRALAGLKRVLQLGCGLIETCQEASPALVLRGMHAAPTFNRSTASASRAAQRQRANWHPCHAVPIRACPCDLSTTRTHARSSVAATGAWPRSDTTGCACARPRISHLALPLLATGIRRRVGSRGWRCLTARASDLFIPTRQRRQVTYPSPHGGTFSWAPHAVMRRGR